jgi:hypothetical protein
LKGGDLERRFFYEAYVGVECAFSDMLDAKLTKEVLL